MSEEGDKSDPLFAKKIPRILAKMSHFYSVSQKDLLEMPLPHFFNLLENMHDIESDNNLRLAASVAKVLFGGAEEDVPENAEVPEEQADEGCEKMKIVNGVAYPKSPEDVHSLIASLGLR